MRCSAGSSASARRCSPLCTARARRRSRIRSGCSPPSSATGRATGRRSPRLGNSDRPCGCAANAPTGPAMGALPGFANGDVSVQDAAAQLAAPFVAASPGMRVLDACAAPGGKTCHLLEAADGIALLALDVDRERATRIQSNVARGGLTAQVVVGDALEPATWWDGQPFDRILL